VRAIVRALAREATHPQELLSRVSSALLADSSSGMYVTCIIAIVDPAARSMTYVNAGHPAGLVWSPRTARGLSVGGPPIGLLPGVHFEEETLAFTPGELVVFMSDGVTEGLDADSDTIVSMIAAQIQTIVRPTPETVCKTLLAAARRGSGPRGVEGWMDDRTVVAFGLLPEAG
jgi:phosphoserine phosphatase RsbU/P